ncbi:MAG: ATP-grasp domain-containing protein [Planctomycetes bacterium]|nr:ATP-grasp domain-containing protein [Planctomycetota bacterium]
MFIVDYPYASEFLNDTIRRNNFKVVGTKQARELLSGEVDFVDEGEAVELIREDGNAKVYLTSENSIEWIEKNIAFNRLPEIVRQFKDKGKFRDLLKETYPDYFYEVVGLDELAGHSLDGGKFPLIVKPTVGFFSLGVYKVNDAAEWEAVRGGIKNEIEPARSLFPVEVLDGSEFIIEECIEGDEYAVDVYFNKDGKPIVLNIMKHLFSSENDVSDRVYLTTKEIILENLGKFDSLLGTLGRLCEIRNFPMHLEVRIDAAGQVAPIEINPMRFGGWCTTGEFTWYCFGFNSYECYFYDIEPDWEEILRDKDDYIYSLLALTNSSGISGEQIKSFDYKKLLSLFEKPLSLREVDYRKHPIFGFLFAQTRKENFKEIEAILHSDLSEFIETK